MDKMAIAYPISAVSKLTGIGLDTLRAWERRYKAVTPARSGRDRLYSEADVHRLRLLRQAVEHGHPIRQAVLLTSSQLFQLAGESAPSEESLADGVVRAIERFDYSQADQELGRLAAILAPRDFLYSVVLPLVNHVGDAYHSKAMTVAQEHMTSALVHNILGVLIRMHRVQRARIKLLFATPAAELHEIGILSAALLASIAGLGVVYLGPDLPAQEILNAAKRALPNAVVLGLRSEESVHELRIVSRELPEKIELWLGGTIPKTKPRRDAGGVVLCFESMRHFEEQVRRLGGRV
jgi:DNA-binding transcriptional MerR regulator/methylmalonyl-CoA mutase cobalamin-binding subunit